MQHASQPGTYWGLPLNRIIAIVVFSALGPVLMLTAPVVASQYASELRLSPSQVGQLIAVESLCMSLATLPAYFWQRRFDWRKVALFAGIVFVLVNLVSGQVNNFYLLMILRAVSALCGGSLMVISMSTAIDSSQPDRIYGLWVFGQLLLGALGLFILPLLFSRFGLSSLYDGLAVVMLLCLPLTRAFSSGHERHEKNSNVIPRERGPLGWIIVGLIAVLLFYLSLSAVWTFMETIAKGSALGGTYTSHVLSIATLVGIVGCLCATVVGTRLRRLWMIVIGCGLMALAILLLASSPGAGRYALAAIIFKFSWTFALPFILASLASMDRTGSVMNSSNIVIGLGLAIGPTMAGWLLGAGTGMTPVLVTSVMLMLVALVLLILVERFKAL